MSQLQHFGVKEMRRPALAQEMQNRSPSANVLCAEKQAE
jgi:hypothetical protein